MGNPLLNRIALAASCTAILCTALAEQPQRGPLRIGFSPNAPDFVQQAAERIYKAAESNAVTRALKGDAKAEYGAINLSEDQAKLAYSHLITVGTPDDPLVRKSQRFLTKFTPTGEKAFSQPKWKMYAFGYGAFSGHIGWIESGANPLLHSSKVEPAPFETELITITGTSADGINAVVDAFLADCLVNGAAAKDGTWKRDSTTLLDLDPLEPGKLPATGFTPPDGWTLMGRYDCPKDVLLGVLETTKKMPVRAVLEKFTRQGELDGAGHENAYRVYLNGLDRHAYGNAAITLFFEDESSARMAARRLESNKRILALKETEPDKDTIHRPVAITQDGAKVVLSTLLLPKGN